MTASKKSLCERCGHPLDASPGASVLCGSCGGWTAVPAGPPLFDAVPFAKEESLEAALTRTRQALEARGLQVYVPDLVNSGLLSRDFGRVMLVFSDPVPHLVYLSSSPWTDALEGLVTTDLIRAAAAAGSLGSSPAFTLLSAHPVPDGVRWTFGNSAASKVDVRIRSAFPPLARVDPGKMAELAEKIGRPLLAELSGREIQALDVAALGILEDVVLRLRPSADPAIALPENVATPYGIGLAFGAIVGEILARLTKVDAQWVPEAQFPCGVGIRLSQRMTGIATLRNPVGKLLKLFLFGSAESLREFYEAARGELESPRGVN